MISDLVDSICPVDESGQAAPSRRGKVTDEHREEARRLRAIWNRTKEERVAVGVGSQEQFGLKYGIGNQAAVGFFLNGKTALSLKAAMGFSRGLGCPISDFSTRLSSQAAGAIADTPAPMPKDDAEFLEVFQRIKSETLRREALAFLRGLAAGEQASPPQLGGESTPMFSRQPRRAAGA
jgi:hypothetical protein